MDRAAFRSGSHRYFTELVRRCGPMVLAVARGFARDADHAEDLFQEIWRTVYLRRESFNGSGSFEGWLHRLATNVCISEYRAIRTRRDADARAAREADVAVEPHGSSSLSDEPKASELRRRLHLALPRLTERERQVLFLRVLEDRPPEEVARILGVKGSTVRSTARNALRRLRRILEVEDEMP